MQLECLDIGESAISDVGVLTVSTHLPLLKKLMLWHCDKLTDVGLHAIGERLKNVGHAFRVADDGYGFEVELNWMLL